jgi:23S rRNA pseudouridine1911/1915/1917 synthase
MFPELSRSAAARLVREGRVKVGDATATRPSLLVEAGAVLVVEVPPPRPSAAIPQALPLRIVFQDDDLAVIDKEAGMVVHPAAGHPDGTLVNALLHHLPDLSGIGGAERPGVVHRLDRGTSGLLVVAKNDAAHRALAAQFAAHTAGRTYLALVHGGPRDGEGTIESHLGRHPTDRVRQASSKTGGRRAVTHWRKLGQSGEVALLSCRLETGRTHQVRVHLSEQGWPIVGDRLYARRGARLPATLKGVVDESGRRPMLHAWRLAFEHPRTGSRMELVAAPPADFAAALRALGLTAP